MGSRAQTVAQVAAVWGRAATEAQLLATVPMDQIRLERALGRLVAADILHELSQPPRLTYVFKHPLVQEVAYASMPDELRRSTHGQIAQFVADRLPETAQIQPELLARHYTEAGQAEQALPLWHQAGQRALQRSATQEAIRHCTRGLELLAACPETPARVQQKLDLLMTLGPAFMAIKGYAAAEVEHTYAQVRTLCGKIGETPRLFSALWGLRHFYSTRGALQPARELGEQLLALAERQDDPAFRQAAHSALGQTLHFMGEFTLARTYLERGITLVDSDQQQSLAIQYGTAPRIQCLALAAHALWSLGYPEQALRRIREVSLLAQKVAHPLSQAYALYFAARLYSFRREVRETWAWAEAVVALSIEHGFAQWVAAGTFVRGWALAAQGQGAEGLAQMHQGMSAVLATGAGVYRAQLFVQLAEIYGQLGEMNKGLQALVEAQVAIDESGRGDYEAETYRLKGALLLAQSIDNRVEAETCFHQALALARRRQAKSWELRAATSLARLWQSQGKHQDAYDLLAPVYNWFTEGFDTDDLREAKGLVEELSPEKECL